MRNLRQARRSGWVAAGVAIWALALGGCEEKKAGATATGSAAAGAPVKLAIASYDPTRELYKDDFNPAFDKWYKQTTGRTVQSETDNDASGKQSRDIISGKQADVAALSVDIDIDNIANAGLIAPDWRSRYPNDSVPYVSAVVFLVRKDNPKHIKDWEDLARDDVTAVAPDPKTGGGARWIYLSTWAHGLRKAKVDGKAGADAEQFARAFTTRVYDKALLDIAMRRSSNRFLQQAEGDVLFGWENEILQIVNDPAAKGQYELVVPSDSITIEVPIAVVDKVADKRGTREAADAYVKFHFADEGQEIIAKRYNRPTSAAVAARHADQFKPLTLYRFKDYFKDWPTVMKAHFAQDGELDRMRAKK